MNNRDRNRRLQEISQSVALGQLTRAEQQMNRPATRSESAKKSYLRVPTAFRYAASHVFGCTISCALSAISDEMRLEALRADNVSDASANKSTISGFALPYETLSISFPGSPQALFKRGAFTKDLREHPNRKVFYGEGFGRVLGSVEAGTCRIWEENNGLHFEAIAPATSWADDLLVSMRRGDTKESAAIAEPVEAHWESRAGARVQVITTARLFLITVVTFPEFDSTTAQVKPDSIAAAAARLARLGHSVYGSKF